MCARKAKEMQKNSVVSVTASRGTSVPNIAAMPLFARALDYLKKGESDSKPIDLDKLRDFVLDFELAIQAIEAGKDEPLPYFKLPYSAD